MIDLNVIAARVWRAIGTDQTATNGVSKEEISYLDYLIKQWHQNLPQQLQYTHLSHDRQEAASSSPGEYRLRIVMLCRRNSMLVQLYRPVLHSVTSIISNRPQAQEVVNVAKETVRTLSHINQTSDIYRSSQVMFNAFLTTALAVLFLAVSHAPALFADQVREEFYMALDLVRGFSRGSTVSKRLWKTIRILKEVGPKLGLPTRDGQNGADGISEDDPNRSAALAMAGLAGHNVDEAALYGPNSTILGGGQWGFDASSLAGGSPEHMANDLTSLFEAAGAFHGNGYPSATMSVGGTAGYPSPFPGSTTRSAKEAATPASVDWAGYGEEAELSRIMRELF